MNNSDPGRSSVRNNFIDILRFALCMVIFLHHSGHVNTTGKAILPSGGLAADAFFMLTGYYAVRHICRVSLKGSENGQIKSPLLYSIRYTINKLIKVFPYAAFGTIIVYILECVVAIRTGAGLTLVDITYKLKDMLIELFFLPLTGLMSLDLLSYRNAPMWYLSAMLFALPFLMWLAFRLKKFFSRLIIWLVPIAIQILFLYRFGGVLPWQDFIGFINSGILRGLSSMLMGATVYYLSTYISDHRAALLKDDKPSLILTIAEAASYVSFLCQIIRGVNGIWELISLYIIMIALSITFSGTTYTSEIKNKAAESFGALSMPVFCVHWGIYRWVSAFFGYLDYRTAVILTLFICLFVAVVLMFSLKGLASLSTRRNHDPS